MNSLKTYLSNQIDFPSHVLEDGKMSDHYSIQDLIGEGLIIEVKEEENHILPQHLENYHLNKGDIIFFKTLNSKINKNGEIKENFVFLHQDTANLLVEKQVKMVGIDYISVDNPNNHHLPVHNTLLKNEILIVENLELYFIPEGRYFFRVYPLNVKGVDGSPVRVTADTIN